MVTDTLGYVTRTDYDDLNRPVRVTTNYVDGVFDPARPDEDLTTVTLYDEVGNAVQVTDQASRITRYEYDELNRVVRTIVNYVDGVFDPARPDEDLVSVTTYDAAGRVLGVTDPASRFTFHEYDALGRVVKVTTNYDDGVYDPAQPDLDLASLTVYNEVGQVAARVQVADQEIATTYGYDAAGRLITTTNALSGTTVTRYDALGRRVETIDAEGNSTTYQYDAAGRLSRMQDAGSNVTTYTYDALGRRVVMTDPLGHTTVYTYNAGGQLVAQADPLGNVTRYEYDALDRRTAMTDADGVAVYSTYDGLGRLIRTQDAGGNETTYVYDALGNRVMMTNANGIATRYEYDGMGRLIAVIENYSTTGPSDHQTNLRTEYTYDVSGNLVTATDALGHTTTYTYDLAGRQVAQEDPLGNVTHYQYDGHGQRVGEVYPDESGPITVTTAYNALGWPTRIEYPAIGDVPGFTVEVGYNELGYRSVVTDATGATTFDYDVLYQPLGIEAPTGDVHYEYDAAGRRTHLIYPTGEVITYTHDAAGRLRTVTDWEGGVTVYTYTAAGRLSGMQLPNGVETRYEYDAAGRLVEIEHSHEGQLLARYEYTLDAVGNRVRVVETILQPEEEEEPTGPGDVVITVRDTDGVPEQGLHVYAFDGTSYTGYNGTTDAGGQVTLVQLPEGSYRFRADKNGTQFWSGGSNHCAVPVCTSAVITTTIPVVVAAEDTDGRPEQGLHVYAFDGATYTGYNGTTDAFGLVTFTLPMGGYRFRADKSGTHFWSGETNHCTIPGCTSAVVTTTIPVLVTVKDTDSNPEAGLPVYAFDGATYTGYNGTTDASGLVTMTLPMGGYRFRADKDGTQFWSGESNHCTVPGCTSTVITTTSPGVTVVVEDTNGNLEPGLPVYAFDGTTYTGYNGTTNVAGTLILILPEGDYRFRADKNGTQFWSGETNHCTVPGCGSAVVTTTIPVVVTVADTDGNREMGLKVYAFDGTTYTGYNKTTDASGLVTFTLPMGGYRFRADKNGTQFWSGETNHCPLPGCTSTVVTTTIPVIVTVEDSGGSPEANLPVYAFDGTTYTGYNGRTDASGLVTFTLPTGGYRFRADKDGVQYWSGTSNHCTVPGCAAVTITVGSQAMRMPGGGMALAQAGAAMPTSAQAELLPDPSYRPPGLASLASRWSEPPLVGSGQPVITTRVITYTYDPLNRLTGAEYSTGESFAYQYDAERIATLLEQYETIQAQRVDEITAYARTVRCRHGHLNAYLGGRTIERCNACDNCVETQSPSDASLPDEREQFLTILRCVATAPWNWGRFSLVRILRGDDEARYGNRSLHEKARQQAEFGSMAFRSQTAIERMLDRLERGGFLQTRQLDHGGVVLDITSTGKAALQNPSALDSLISPAKTPPTRKSPEKDEVELDVDEALFQALRTWRLEQAREQQVPPYVIFHDSHLRAIAAHQPVTLEALSEVKGVGPRKLGKYGAAVIELVRKYLEGGVNDSQTQN